MTRSDPTVIFILGAPGSGKGTLSTKLAQDHWLHHISLGDHLRSLQERQRHEQGLNRFSPLSVFPVADSPVQELGGLSLVEYTAYMTERKLLPTNVILGILRTKVADYTETGLRRGFERKVVDGFPRNVESARAWDEEYGRPAKVLVFNCPADVAQQRFQDRGRSADDDGVVFAKRYEEYERLNGEIVEHYTDLVVEIDTSGKTEDSYNLLKQRIQDDPVLKAFCS